MVFENLEKNDKYKKTKKIHENIEDTSNKNPNELWDYNIPQSIDDVWSDFELRIKKEKWDEILIEKESESNLWRDLRWSWIPGLY